MKHQHRNAGRGSKKRLPRGELRLQLRELLGGNVEKNGKQRSKIILEAQSSLSGLEVGGGPWDEVWRSN